MATEQVMPRPHGSPQVGGRPHKHPSISCYRKHGCRCEDCTRLNAKSRAHERAKRREYRPNPTPLDDVTLARLRRAVGLE